MPSHYNSSPSGYGSYGTYEVRPSQGHSRHTSSRRRDYDDYGSAGIDISTMGGGFDYGYSGGYNSNSRSHSRRDRDYTPPSRRDHSNHYGSSSRARKYDNPFEFRPTISDARLDGYLAGYERRRGDDYGRRGVDLGTLGGEYQHGYRNAAPVRGHRSSLRHRESGGGRRRHVFRFWKN